jgi:glutathione reductase (NADPH)
MANQYDVIVIGSGPAGGTVAAGCRKAGLRVAVIEDRGYGGTCPLRGCNPKKVLVGAAEAVNRSADLQGKGIAHGSRIAWPELIRFKRSFTEPVSAAKERSFHEIGIDTFSGQARFTGKRRITVNDRTLAAANVVIATGAKARRLPIPGKEHLIEGEAFMEIDDLPDSVTFIGGGYISFEFAHVAARAGAKVTVLEMQASPLAGFDPELVEILVEASRDRGFDLRTETPIHSVEKRGNGFLVRAGKEGSETFETGLVINSSGRVPAIEDLDLRTAGVENGPKGVAVNDFMQSVTNPAVYAAGDCAETPLPLTPTAVIEADAVVENILNGNTRKPDYTGIPSAAFTIPPLAMVGMTEKELKDRVSLTKRYSRTPRIFSPPGGSG